MVVLFQKQLAPFRRNPDNRRRMDCFISGLIMSVSPPSRTLSRPDSLHTLQNKAASYQEMGDLIYDGVPRESWWSTTNPASRG